MRRLATCVLVIAALACGGCSTVAYYAQAVTGHFDMIRRAEPIADTLARESTPARLRERLVLVQRIRDYASRELALPDNGSYRKYADLGRPFVVWNVFAAPEFSVSPRRSCFPVAGCVSYQGFYAESDARAHADALHAQGFDVYLGGVPAYSTLGWFDDPVLNTFVFYPEPELARLIFHELAHQVAYASGDTVFNESFAVAVEREGLRRWLAAFGTPAQREAWAASQSRRARFIALALEYRDRLARLYAGPGTAEERREDKKKVFDAMRADYERIKREEWGGFAGYDRFFEQGANNALLASISAYNELVPAFEELLAQKRGDLAAFYAEVKSLAAVPREQRNARLRAGSGLVAEEERIRNE